MTKRYQKLNAQVDALQWTGSNQAAIHAFCPYSYPPFANTTADLIVNDIGNAGFRVLNVGDYIIKDAENKFTYMTAAQFTATYGEVTP